MRSIFTFLFLNFFFALQLMAQPPEEDLSKLMEEEMTKGDKTQIDYAIATFKATRLVNGHTNEQMPRGVMDFRISHRFGPFNGGIYEFFGLDQANMRMALEYGVTNWFMVGGGRSNYEKTYDVFAKFKILRQSKGAFNMPVSLNYLATWATKTVKFTDLNRKNYYTSNFYFTHQLIIARKFSESIALLIAPTVVHRNLVATTTDKNDLLSLGIGGRIKLTRSTSLNMEYYYQIDRPAGTVDCFSIGFDIETGGHVFQLTFSNSPAQIERAFIHETTARWQDGAIMGGFNISRVFTLVDYRKRGTKNPDAEK